MHEQLILATAEAAAPSLRALARKILEAEAEHLGLSLDRRRLEPTGERPRSTSPRRLSNCSSTWPRSRRPPPRTRDSSRSSLVLGRRC